MILYAFAAPLALGLAGGLVGSFFGLGNVGFLLGTLAGSLLFTKKQKITGPLPPELQFTDSIEGRVIPKIYGRFKLAGNIIHFHSITRRHQKTKNRQKFITYRRIADYAVAICEGVAGLLRFTANGTLLYDNGKRHKYCPKFRFYTGTETQLPDPVMEEVEGKPVPAYRGLSYIVFDSWNLEKWGQQPPNIFFEVISKFNPQIQHNQNTYSINGISPSTVLEGIVYGNDRKFHIFGYESSTDGISVITVDPLTNNVINRGPVWTEPLRGDINRTVFSYLDGWFGYRTGSVNYGAFRTMNLLTGEQMISSQWDPVKGQFIVYDQSTFTESSSQVSFPVPKPFKQYNGLICWWITHERVRSLRRFTRLFTPELTPAWIYDTDVRSDPEMKTAVDAPVASAIDYAHGKTLWELYPFTYNLGETRFFLVKHELTGDLPKKWVFDGTWDSTKYTTLVNTTEIRIPDNIIYYPNETSGNIVKVKMGLNSHGNIIVMWADDDSTNTDPKYRGIARFAPDGTLLEYIYADELLAAAGVSSTAYHELWAWAKTQLEENLKYSDWFMLNLPGSDGYIAVNSENLRETLVINAPYTVYTNEYYVMYSDIENGVVHGTTDNSLDIWHWFVLDAINTDTVYLGDVIKDLADRSGLGSARVDTTAVDTVPVRGYALVEQRTFQDCLGELAIAYSFIDIIKDGKIVIKPIDGGNPIVEINNDMLVDEFVYTYDRSVNVPSRVVLRYVDDASLEQAYVEAVDRSGLASENRDEYDIPVVMTRDEALKAAYVRLYVSRFGRHVYRFSVPINIGVRLDVWDVVKLNIYTENHHYDGYARIRGITVDGLKYEIEAIAWEPELFNNYSLTTDASALVDYVGTVSERYPQSIMYMQLPSFREDTNHTIWFNAYRWGPYDGEEGFTIFNANLNDVGDVANGHFVGMVKRVNAPNDVDQQRESITGYSIEVEYPTTSASFTNPSQSAAVRRFDNDFLIIGNNVKGWQLVQHEYVSATTSGYEFGNLLFYRNNTMDVGGDVNVGDLVLKVNSPDELDEVAIADIHPDQPYQVRFEPYDFSPVIEDTLIYKANDIKPPKVANLRTYIIDTSTMRINWVRTNRWNYQWLNFSDIPLDDLMETYRVYVYDYSDNLLDTIETNETSANVKFTEIWPNVSVNGGFENGDLTNWSGEVDLVSTGLSSLPYEGSYMGKTQYSYSDIYHEVKLPVSRGDVITVKFAAQYDDSSGSGGYDLGVDVQWYRNGTQIKSVNIRPLSPLPSDWQLFEYQVVADDEYDSMVLYFDFNRVSGSFSQTKGYVDAVEVRKKGSVGRVVEIVRLTALDPEVEEGHKLRKVL